MITLIHGDDIVSSRNFLNDEKSSLKNPVMFSGQTINLENLIRSLEGGSLFEKENEIIIENLLSSKKAVSDFDKIIEYLNKNSVTSKIYIWENQEIKGQVPFKNSLQKVFKIPQNIFLFLDSIKHNNPITVKLFHQAIETSSEDAIFYMIVRQFRLMLALLEEGKEIDEVKRLQPWQRNKIRSQSLSIGKENLQKAYKKLYEIDLGYKSGGLSQPLLQSVDFFLLDL